MKIPLSSSDWYKSTVPGDGSQINIKSTSAATASVSPIILSQSETDVTRIVFQPVLVDNPNDRDKCVSGKLIYEKKSKGDEYPTEKITPRIIKTGEIMELSLDTTAVFTLFQTITLLYDMYAKNGIPYGTASYERIDSSFHTFLEIIQNDPSAARMIGSTENFELVKILLQLITTTESTESLKNALQNLQNKNMEQLSQSISIERLNRVIALIEDNLDNSNEEFWQSEVFKDNQWVLAQLFASPCTIFQDKAYVGGKSIDNHKGNLCDFLYQNQITNNVALIEIKTPTTQIIHNRYRQTFSFSHEMSGAVNQVINYRDSLMKEYNSIRANSRENFSVFNPKCIVIIGRLSSLERGQIAAFENYRNSLNNIEIIAYDEILLRLKDLRDIFNSDFSFHAVEEEEYPF
ncbi:MAG: Shedu immune nuclease family protein [Erysipelotrichaceae bacterium]|jgi:hypothetical protein